MKAVIMAGGEGQRLRPITCNVPKPMLKISGKPVVEYAFDLLIKHGFKEATLTLAYLPEKIESAYESGYKSLKLDFSRETEPLGTAGSVKNAVGSCKETVLVISGDGICDFDLSGIIRYHKASSAAVTVVATKVAEPREYGLINVGEHNRIVGFTEKPSWSQAVTNLANTGIYLIEPEAFAMIPDGKKFDFAKDLFPLLIEKDIPIFCYNAEGYWCDIGSVESYLTCQNNALDSEFTTPEIALVSPGDFTVIPPVYIGKNVDISSSAVIGPYACIENGCVVESNARVRYSIVSENSFIGSNASVTGAVLSQGVSVKNDASVYENSVIGAGTVIGCGADIKPNVKVWPGKVISNNASVDSNVKYGSVKKHFITGDGICNSSSVPLDVETCVKLGRAVGTSRNGKKVGIATDGGRCADALAKAFTAGVLSSGGSVWNFGTCFKAQLNFLVNFCELSSGVFISAENEREIYICGEGGLSIPRFFERSLEAAMQSGNYTEASSESIKEDFDVCALTRFYEEALKKQAPYGLAGVSAEVLSDNPMITAILEKTLKKLGADSESSLFLNIDSDGSQLHAVTEKGEIEHHMLLAAACYAEMKKGRDIAVPYDAPDFLDSLAEVCRRSVYRYLTAPCDDSDSDARRLASKQIFVRDSLFLAVKILSIMKEREISLDELINELPQKFIINNDVSISYTPSSLAEIVGENTVTAGRISEGIRVSRSNGKLLIIPDRSGETVRVTAEADSMEAAKELCIDMCDIISSYNINNSLT